MKRWLHSLWLPALGALAACGVPARSAPAKKEGPVSVKGSEVPVRTAPTRPIAAGALALGAPRMLWPFTEIHGTEYVDVRELAARFSLKVAWSKPELAITLSDESGVRFAFETHQRDFHFDRLRIFLGRPALFDRGTLWVSRLDVIKLVAPLFQPNEHVEALPATAPRLIVLDPGHGGTDSGTENKRLGVNEKTFTLDVAFRLKKILEADGYRVLLTREKDTRFSSSPAVDLPLRADFANKAGADLFISIHFNNAPQAISGVETYSLTPQHMFSAGDENGDDMTRQAFPGNKLDFANLLLGERMHRAMLGGLKTPDRGYKHARWAVLRTLNCPGVLVESAYLSNDAEARRVATPEFRQQIAESIAAGVQSYSRALENLRAMVAQAK
jgi:N-acetylmuramoyl-L-alanine amidase